MNLHSAHLVIEPLESRIAPAATLGQIAQALDLPDGVTVNYTGNSAAVAVKNYVGKQLFDFPSGSDADFLVLSTGIADKVDKLKDTGGEQGTDFTPKHDPAGDQATVSFTLNVPASSSEQRLKFDLRLLTEEWNDFVQIDAFKFRVDGSVKLGLTTTATDGFTEIPDPNPTFLDAATEFQTVSFPVPAGATSLTIDFVVQDSLFAMAPHSKDGFLDTVALIDNVRFERPQVVFLDFDGGSLTRGFVDDASIVNVPAFTAADVMSMDPTQTVIDSVVNKVRGLYAAYDIQFVTTQPTSGDFMKMVIGGDNDTVTVSTLDNHPVPNNTSSWRSYTGMKAGSTLFGRAAAVDIGNLNRQDIGIMFSGVFDNFYGAEDTATIQNRLAVTLAHEIGHNLGLRHLDDVMFDSDVMAQFSPRSPSATFVDATSTLAETWDDGATTQNDDQYLKSVLGTEGSLVSTFQKALNRFLNTLFGSLDKPVYDAAIVVWQGGGPDSDGTEPELYAQVFNVAELSGPTELQLPISDPNAKIGIFGHSAPGMSDQPYDIFSGNPDMGAVSLFGGSVPLFDAGGDLKQSFDLSIGAPGNLQPFAKVTAATQDAGPPLPGGKGTFSEPGNDTATVTLTGPGEIRVLQNTDGSIAQIILSNTDPATSALSIKVKESISSDGFFKVGTIVGTGVKSITAPKVDLDGAGVALSGPVGKVVFHDLEKGADVRFDGGTVLQKTTFTARDVEDGANFHFATSISSFKVARVGDGVINAPAIASLKIGGDKKAGLAGDFESDVVLFGGLPAGSAVLGSAKIAGKAQGANFRVAGNVGSFSAGIFKDSSLFAGFTPTNVADPMAGGLFTAGLKIASFKASGIKNNAAPSFENSVIAASDIGTVTLASIDVDNPTIFGVLADNSIGKVTAKDPVFNFPGMAGLDDFLVKIV